MDPTKKLIVPEINARITAADKIIANPNCSFKWFYISPLHKNTTSNV
jgi:aspartate-semialdehyde dehydrogenase